MYTKSLALTGAFAVLASAVPMAKRDVVWVTKVEEDVVTVPVTTTVWVDPTGAPQHFGHYHGGHKKQTTVHSTINVYPSAAPAPSSEAAPSSYSAPPAPSSAAAPASASQESSSAAPASSSVYVASTTSSSIYIAPTSSPSAYVPPTTSSSIYVAPTTSEAPSSTSEAAPASYSGSSSSGSGLTYGMAKAGTSYSGDFTYFQEGMGACGHVSHDDDHMVAVSHTIFDSYAAEAGGNSNNNPICGKTVNINGVDGTMYPATVWDRCVGCDEGSLDLPELFFNITTNYADGRAYGMKWSFA